MARRGGSDWLAETHAALRESSTDHLRWVDHCLATNDRFGGSGFQLLRTFVLDLIDERIEKEASTRLAEREARALLRRLLGTRSA